MAKTAAEKARDLRLKQALSMVGGDESKLSPGFMEQLQTGDFAPTQKIVDVAKQQKKLGQAVTGRGNLIKEPTQPRVAAPDMAEELKKVQRQKSISALEAAKQTALAGTEAARSQIAPAFAEARRGAITQAQQQARSFGEYLASRGLGMGAQAQGAEQQATIAGQVASQQQLGGLRSQEAGALSDVALQEAGIRRDFAQNLSDLEAGLTITDLQGRIQAQEAQRQEQVARANTLELKELDQSNRIELANVNAQINDAIRNNDFARTQQLTLLKETLGRERDAINQKFDLQQLGARGAQSLQQIAASGAQQRQTAEFKAGLEGVQEIPLTTFTAGVRQIRESIPTEGQFGAQVPGALQQQQSAIADFIVDQNARGSMTDEQAQQLIIQNQLSMEDIVQAENRARDLPGLTR